MRSISTQPKKKLDNDNYRKACKDLQAIFGDKKKLPRRLGTSDAENQPYDEHRIDFIRKALAFIQAYGLDISKIKNDKTRLENFEESILSCIALNNVLQTLHQICITIHNLSGQFRSTYKNSIKKYDLTWEHFERFAAVITVRALDSNTLPIQINDDSQKQLILDFHAEYQAIIPIMEAGAPKLLTEIPHWQKLFNLIGPQPKQPHSSNFFPTHVTTSPLTAADFTVTKIYIKRLYTTEILADLLRLCSNTMSDNTSKPINQAYRESELHNNDELGTVDLNNIPKRQTQINSPIDFYAALRRLEKIGEAITARNFDTRLAKLNPEVDWEAIKTLRNLITHQGEHKDLPELIARCNDDGLLQAIIDNDFPELYGYLIDIIVARQSKYDSYENNPEDFWNKLLPAKAVEFRVPKDKIVNFTTVLKNHTIDSDKRMKWASWLMNKVSFDSKEMGVLMKDTLPSRKDYPDDYNTCRNIINEAKNFKPTAPVKEITTSLPLKGLDNLRALYRKLYRDENKKDFEVIDRVNLAIAALENIASILASPEYFNLKLDFKSLKQWKKHYKNIGIGKEIIRILDTQENIREAIEHLAGQLLENLDSIKKTDRYSDDYEYLAEDKYETLRELRNWIAHGNQYYDIKSYEPQVKYDDTKELDKILVPMMIKLYFKLLPDLKQIQANLLNHKSSLSY